MSLTTIYRSTIGQDYQLSEDTSSNFTVGRNKGKPSFVHYINGLPVRPENQPLIGRVSQRPNSTPTVSEGGGSKPTRLRAVTLPVTSTKESSLPSYEQIFTKLKFFFDSNVFTIKSAHFSEDQKLKVNELEIFARRILEYASIIKETAQYEEDLLYIDDIKEQKNETKLKKATECANRKIYDPIRDLNYAEFESLCNRSKQSKVLLELIKSSLKALNDLSEASTFRFEE